METRYQVLLGNVGSRAKFYFVGVGPTWNAEATKLRGMREPATSWPKENLATKERKDHKNEFEEKGLKIPSFL